MVSSVLAMIRALRDAEGASLDPPIENPQALGTRTHTEGPGRPRVDISREDLALLSSGRSRLTDIAVIYDCSARTIRRRLLDYGLADPGPSVYEDLAQQDGGTLRIYRPGHASNLSSLTNPELDQIMLSIYYQFPSFGRRMIDGYLLELGQRVPRARIEQSYRRVIGPPTRTFAPRRLVRREYNVPGPNSLWHHDGQHGKYSVSQGL